MKSRLIQLFSDLLYYPYYSSLSTSSSPWLVISQQWVSQMQEQLNTFPGLNRQREHLMIAPQQGVGEERTKVWMELINPGRR